VASNYDPRRSFSLVTPPSAEPLTLAEAKTHLRLETSADDAYVTRLITAARVHVEGETRRTLIEQTRRMMVPTFPPGAEPLRLRPLPFLLAVKLSYLADDDVETDTEIVSPRYGASKDDPWVIPPIGQDWPTDLAEREDAVRVDFKCGYGPAGTDVPETLRQAMLLVIGSLYENRETEVIGTISSALTFSLDALMERYVVRRP